MSNDELAIEGLSDDDRNFAGSRFAEVRDAIFANPYQKIWGAAGQPPFERAPVTFGTVMRGLLAGGKPWVLLAAARRTLASKADLRWGPDGKGYRRLLPPHPPSPTRTREITQETPHTRHFNKRTPG